MQTRFAGLLAGSWFTGLAAVNAIDDLPEINGGETGFCVSQVTLLTPHLDADGLYGPVGQRLVGTEVRFDSSGVMLEVREPRPDTSDICRTYYQAPPDLQWELVTRPADSAAALAKDLSAPWLARLRLDAAGTYEVRLLICSNGCDITLSDGHVLRVEPANRTVSFEAVSELRFPPETRPSLPLMDATFSTSLPNGCGELGGLLSAQWATVFPWSGPEDYTLLEGLVQESRISVKDMPFNHASQDFCVIVHPDGPFGVLVAPPDQENVEVEWERNQLPEAFRPTRGDRLSVVGYWIRDCGHDSKTEIHPPVLLASHRPRPISIPERLGYGANIFVPGIVTDLWINDRGGALTDSCNTLGLGQPYYTNGPAGPFRPCVPRSLGYSRNPINRLFEFNIYLPRDPQTILAAVGVTNVPPTPLYVEITNPWGAAGPEPVIRTNRTGRSTYLTVAVDLTSASLETYSRRIQAAWVYPCADNWGLQSYRLTLGALDVHRDGDGTNAVDRLDTQDGDWRFWFNTNNRDQEWTKLFDGDNNVHGFIDFGGRPWQTGPAVAEDRYLGPDVLLYPRQELWVQTCGFEDDYFLSDSTGDVTAIHRPSNIGGNCGEGGFCTLSRCETEYGGFRGCCSYTLHYRIEPGLSVGPAVLTTAGQNLCDAYLIRADQGLFLDQFPRPTRAEWHHPITDLNFRQDVPPQIDLRDTDFFEPQGPESEALTGISNAKLATVFKTAFKSQDPTLVNFVTLLQTGFEQMLDGRRAADARRDLLVMRDLMPPGMWTSFNFSRFDSILEPPSTSEQSHPNSLWIGTDNSDGRDVLNTDRSGVILRIGRRTDTSGLAIDLDHNRIYMGASGGRIDAYDLPTLTAGAAITPPEGAPLGEDMAFDGVSIWRSGIPSRRVYRISPADGSILFSFPVGFDPMGVAWDGAGLWISEFAQDGRVIRYDTNGRPTGQQFSVTKFITGGLAYDTTDGTLWVGTWGKVYHYSTNGTELGSFVIPAADGRFADGLEFQGSPRVSILDISLLLPNHEPRIRHTADSDSYFILYRGNSVTNITTVVDTRLGQGSHGELRDPVPASQATAFYRVGQVPLKQPLDSDGDGIDDVYELRHARLLDPLTSGDAPGDVDHDGLNNLQEYRNGSNPEDGYDGRWVSIGPTLISDDRRLNSYQGILGAVGRIACIAIPPNAPSTVYVGARGMGVWRTIDGGLAWQPVADDLPSLNIEAIAVDGSVSTRVYVCTPAGIFRSDDSGTSWDRIYAGDLAAVGSDGRAMRVDPGDSNVLYLPSQSGLYRSTDRGTNWTGVVSTAQGALSGFAMDPLNPMNLYVGTPQLGNSGIFVSLDRGTNWANLTGCGGGRLPADSAGFDIRLAISGSRIYAGYLDYNQSPPRWSLYRSTDSGCLVGGRVERVWEKAATFGADSVKLWSGLYADPTDANFVFVAGTELWTSTNGGSSFVHVTDMHADQHGFAFDPINPRIVYCGTDGGIFRSTDHGLPGSWAFIGAGIANAELYDIADAATNPNLVIASSQDNGLSRYDASGTIWQYLGGGVSGDSEACEIDPFNGDAFYQIGQFMAQIVRSSDGGLSWPPPAINSGLPAQPACDVDNEFGPPKNHFLVHPTMPSRLYLTCGSLYGYSATANPPWSIIPTPGNVSRLAIDGSVNLLFAGGSGGRLYLGPSGTNWQTVWTHPNGATPTDIEVDPLDSATVYICVDRDSGSNRVLRLRRSSSAPFNWAALDITANLPDGVNIRTLAVDPLAPHIVFAGSNQGVYRGHSPNGNSDWVWTSYNDGMPRAVFVTDLEVHPVSGVIRAATFGRSAYQLDLEYPIGSMLSVEGTIALLRANDPGTGYGPSTDMLDAEVIVTLDTLPDRAFGFQLRDNADEGTRRGMLDLLRDAFRRDQTIHLDYVRTGLRNGRIVRVTEP